MNKQTIIVCMILFLLIIPSVIAAPFDFLNNIRGGSTGFGVYDRHKDILDFGIFFVLFLAVTWLSVRSFYSEKEQRNPALAIAIVVAIALSIAALKAGLSPSFAGPFMKYVLFFLGVVLIYLLFVKLFHVETAGGRIAAFLLALLLLWLLFNIGNFAFEKPRIGLPDGGGVWEKTKDFFRGLTKAPTRTIDVEGEEEGERVQLEEEQGEEPGIADKASKKASELWNSFKNIFKKTCTTDADCDGGTCKASTDGKTKSCVECTSDTQCEGSKVCDLKENECVEETEMKAGEKKAEEPASPTEKKCTKQDDCADGEICLNDICVEKAEGCSADADCPDNEYCDQATKECSPEQAGPPHKICTTSKDCLEKQICDNGRCIGVKCTLDSHCPAEKQWCNTNDYSCYGGECKDRNACPSDKPVCLFVGEETKCVQCRRDLDCPVGGKCDVRTNTCITTQQTKPEEIEGYNLYPNVDLAGSALFSEGSLAGCARTCDSGDDCVAFVWVKSKNKCYGKSTPIMQGNTPPNVDTDLYVKEEKGILGSTWSFISNNWWVALIIALIPPLLIGGKLLHQQRTGGTSSFTNREEFVREFQTTLHNLEQEVGSSLTEQFERYDQFLNNLRGGGS